MTFHSSLRFLISLALGTKLLLACECGVQPICARVGAINVIFLGTALNDSHPPGLAHKLSDIKPVRFKIDRSYKGIRRDQTIVDVDTSADTSCEVSFARSRHYIVFAEHTDHLWTNSCLGSKLFEEANEDIKFLDRYSKGETESSIEGEVYPNVQPGSGREYDRLLKKLAGSIITARSVEGYSYGSTADGAGHFLIPTVKPASYKVRVERSFFLPARPTYQANVAPGACASLFVRMDLNGRVSGTILEPSGHSAASVKLHLIPILTPDADGDPIEAVSSPSGAYHFSHIPPGHYLLAVNDSAEPTPENPFKRVYYPGVASRAKAALIEMGEAQVLSNVNLRVSEKMSPRTIRVQIVWSDGSPARFVHTWCAPVGDSPWQHLLTDGNGQIIFKAMDGLSYEIGAAAASDYEIESRRRFSAKKIVVPAGTTTSAKLVISIAPKR